jgi:hypothetical protein
MGFQVVDFFFYLFARGTFQSLAQLFQDADEFATGVRLQLVEHRLHPFFGRGLIVGMQSMSHRPKPRLYRRAAKSIFNNSVLPSLTFAVRFKSPDLESETEFEFFFVFIIFSCSALRSRTLALHRKSPRRQGGQWKESSEGATTGPLLESGW